MKNRYYLFFMLFLSFIFNGFKSQAQERADTIVGISGSSAFSKYLVQVIGSKKDTISVFDSAKVSLPLKSDYYWLRVYRITYKGELLEFKVKSFNMVFSDPSGDNKTMAATNKYIMDPMLQPFKEGVPGAAFSIGQITIEDEKGKERNLGSFQLFYQ